MTKIETTLLDRTTTSFGISIGTGLMLESIFTPTTDRYDKDRVPSMIKINDYSIHYYNIYTLIRNIISAVKDKEVHDRLLTSDYLFDTLLEEVRIINELYVGTNCKPILYIPNYTDIIKNMSTGKPVSDTINRDVFIFNYTLGYFSKKARDVSMATHTTVYKLPKNISNVLITTSYPVDLLNNRYIPNLKLMESHTGVLKDKSKWYTKYHKIGSRDLSILPFTETLLYLLGDNKFIKSISTANKIKLYQHALDNKWTVFTEDLRIRNELRAIPEFKEYLDRKLLYV